MDTNTNQPNTTDTASASTTPVTSTANTENKIAAPAQQTVPPNTPDNQDIFVQFADRIIREQEGIIGPIAYEQASKVPGITIDPTTHAIQLKGDKKQILENLVKQYELLFGRVSIEICKEAVRGVISNAPADQVPQILL